MNDFNLDHCGICSSFELCHVTESFVALEAIVKTSKEDCEAINFKAKIPEKMRNHSLKPRRKLLFLNHEARGSCSWSKILCSLNIVCTNPSSNHVFWKWLQILIFITIFFSLNKEILIFIRSSFFKILIGN